jgi:hypothetical protein
MAPLGNVLVKRRIRGPDEFWPRRNSSWFDRDNFSALRAVTTDVEFRSINGPVPLLGALHPGRVFYDKLGAQGLALEVETGNVPADDDLQALRTRRRGGKFTPASNVLHAWLREPLRATIPDDVRYTEAFDGLEMVLALIAADLETQTAEYYRRASIRRVHMAERVRPNPARATSQGRVRGGGRGMAATHCGASRRVR